MALRLVTKRSSSVLSFRTRKLQGVVRVSSHAYSSSSGKSGSNGWQRLRGMAGSKMLAASVVAVGVTGYVQSNSTESSSEPNYDAIRKDIAKILDNNDYDDGSYGPVLVRLAWHASGTYDKGTGGGGSNGATMRFHPEASHGANAGLGVARQILEPIKNANPNISYADLWTLAGVVAIEEMGGPKISWRPGRSDAPDNKSCPPDGRLPDASKSHDHVRDIFYRMGFNDGEIVALIGAHSIGRCHKDRSGFDGPWTRAPTTFSNEYFKLLLSEKWAEKKWKGPRQFENVSSGSDLMMLPADMALLADPKFKKYVEIYAKDQKLFFDEFAKAFSRLLEVGVKFPENKSLWQRIFG